MSFDIVAHKKWWFTLSSVLVVLSVISIFINGFNFGIDYTGGTILDLQFKQPVTVAQVREVIDDSNMNLENSVIQLSGVTDQESSQEVMIRMRNLESDESKAISDQLNEKLGGAEVKRIESVGAVIGSEVTKNAVTSLAVAFIALAAYISIRFEYKIAISAIVSILHDLIMVLGFFSFFQLEIDASFLAAILTVVGYSKNEAVVIFDRVRENMAPFKHKDKTKADIPFILETSVTQCLRRALFTTFTTLITIVILAFFGINIPSLSEFALPIIFGILSGLFSSIFLAPSIWGMLMDLKNKKTVQKAKAKRR